MVVKQFQVLKKFWGVIQHIRPAFKRLLTLFYPLLEAISYNLPTLAYSIISEAGLTNSKRSSYRLEIAFRITTAIENDESTC